MGWVWGKCWRRSAMAPALTRGAVKAVVKEARARNRGRSSSHGMEMPWAQCVGKTLMFGTLLLYVLIAAALLMLVVAAGYEKSWKVGLMISLIFVLWGCVGGCGLHWVLVERRRRDSGERADGTAEGQGREIGLGSGQGRDSGLGGGGAKLHVEGHVQYESLYPQLGGEETRSDQEVLGDGECEPLLRSSPVNEAMAAVAARAGVFSG